MNSLKRLTTILFLFSFFFLTEGGLKAQTAHKLPDKNQVSVDSIVQQAMFYAQFYEKVVKEYHAELYIKGWLDIPKKNFGFRYLPKMVRMKKGVSQYLLESVSDIHYTAPNIYDQKVRASYSTTNSRSFQASMLEYFHVNIYSSTMLYDRFLSPLGKNGHKYYKYHIDSIYCTGDDLHYRVRFRPKSKSDRLVGGFMVVTSDVWSIREIRFSGRYELVTLENHLQMGAVGDDDEFLPVRFDMNAIFGFLGNVLDGRYSASLRYKDIKLNEGDKWIKRKKKYDLTESYTLTCDTNAFNNSRVNIDTLRHFDLQSKELNLYNRYLSTLDTIPKVKKQKNSRVFWGNVGEFLLTDINVNLNNIGSVRCSPIINPFLLSYSGKNGFSWRQDFRFFRLFNNDKLLRIRPRIGYNFTRKEFYWMLRGEFEYYPEKQGRIHLAVGNGNRIYSSDVLDDLKAIPDSLFDFNVINLEYFRDLFFEVNHRIEVLNGLDIDVGFNVHKRTPINKSNILPLDPDNPVPPEISEKIKSSYISFAPGIKVRWTPGMYYYMNGRRKINLRSNYPTFSVDYERAIKGVFNSTGQYERIEFDVQHQVSLNFMRNIYYRVGVGMFSNQKELYFVDFVNFSRNNLPTGWNDDIGGTFHLLDGRWYNSSRKYARAHFTYEAPFLFMRHLMKYTRYVQNERLYVSVLTVPHLKPYVELGYGIGTHVFDFGVFVSAANWQYREVGCKFTFELFNR